MQFKKFAAISGLLLLALYTSIGCRGTVLTTTGSIDGPDFVEEYSGAQYKALIKGGSVATYQWSCNPPNAGQFDLPASASTKFIPNEVFSDTAVEISVSILLSNATPILLKKYITIRDVTGLRVPEIEGPSYVDENASVEYGISPSGDTGITCLWSCEPHQAGLISNPASSTTEFTAAYVTSDTPVIIKATIDSDHFGPVIRTKEITILEKFKILVGEILGPEIMIETVPSAFEISAYGDTGISFLWSCIPTDAGEFDTLTSPKPQFTPAEVATDTPIEIIVEINSDNYSQQIKTKNITIRDTASYTWSQTWGAEIDDCGRAVAIDNHGNIYITGSYQYQCDFDPGSPYELHISKGGRDAFLSKYDSNGAYWWTQTWGGHRRDVGRWVALDDSGNVYVASVCDTFNKSDDFYLKKFSADGVIIWELSWGEQGSDGLWAVVPDGLGNIYVTGYFSGVVDFDPGPGTDEHVSYFSDDWGYTEDAFLSKFTTDGEYEWTWNGIWNNQDDETGIRLDTDATGHVYVACNTMNVSLYKIDPYGETVWIRKWGGKDADYCTGLRVTESGDIYVSGVFYSPYIDLCAGTATDIHWSNGYGDIFMVKYDTHGDYQWGLTFGGWGADRGRGLAIDQHDNIYITGSFLGTVDFDPSQDVFLQSTIGKNDAFISKFNAEGCFQWAQSFGGDEDDIGYGIHLDPYGNIIVTGAFSADADFDPEAGLAEHTSKGLKDIFLLFLTTGGG